MGVLVLVLDDTWPAVPASVARARSAVGSAAVEAGIADGLVHNLKVAVSEAATNVVIHAYADRDAGAFGVRMDVEGDAIDIVVRDHGRGMVPRPDSPGLGLGLPLIANLSDRLEIQEGPDGVGTQLEMVFALQREAPSSGH